MSATTAQNLDLRLRVEDEHATRAVKSLSDQLKGLAKATAAISAAFAAFGATKFLHSAFNEARGLEEQMKVIQGLAGKTDAEFRQFATSLETVARGIGSITAKDMAAIAQTAVQLGVNFGETGEEILQFSTSVGYGSIALSAFNRDTLMLSTHLAKQMAVFGDGTDKINNYMSSMFKMETTTAATSLQISEFNQALGASAKQMGMSQSEASAWGATLIAAGMDASNAATRVGSAYTQFLKNLTGDKRNSLRSAVDAISSAADGGAASIAKLEEITGRSRNSFADLGSMIQSALGINGAATFRAIGMSLGQMSDNIKMNQLAFDMWGQIGSKAMSTIALNSNLLEQRVADANDAFDKGVAIQEAYKTISESNSEILKVFGSIVNDISLQIGGPLLTAFARFAKISLIPLATQMSDWLQSSTKMQTFFQVTLPHAAEDAGRAINAVATGVNVVAKVAWILADSFAQIFGLISQNMGETYPLFDVLAKNIRVVANLILTLKTNPFSSWIQSSQVIQTLFGNIIPTAIRITLQGLGMLLDAILPIGSEAILVEPWVRNFKAMGIAIETFTLKWNKRLGAIGALVNITPITHAFEMLSKYGLNFVQSMETLSRTLVDVKTHLFTLVVAGNKLSQLLALLQLRNDLLEIKSIFSELFQAILPISPLLNAITGATNFVTESIRKLGDIAYGHSVFPEIFRWVSILMTPFKSMLFVLNAWLKVFLLIDGPVRAILTTIKAGVATVLMPFRLAFQTIVVAIYAVIDVSKLLIFTLKGVWAGVELLASGIEKLVTFLFPQLQKAFNFVEKQFQDFHQFLTYVSDPLIQLAIKINLLWRVMKSAPAILSYFVELGIGVNTFEKYLIKSILALQSLFKALSALSLFNKIGDTFVSGMTQILIITKDVKDGISDWQLVLRQTAKEFFPIQASAQFVQSALYGIAQAIDYIAEIGWRHSVFPEFVIQLDIIIRRVAWIDRNIKHAIGVILVFGRMVHETFSNMALLVAARDALRRFANVLQELTGIDLRGFFRPFGDLTKTFSAEGLVAGISATAKSLQNIFTNLASQVQGPLKFVADILRDYVNFQISMYENLITGGLEAIGRLLSGDVAGALYVAIDTLGTHIEYRIERLTWPLRTLVPQIATAQERMAQSIHRIIVGLGNELFEFLALVKPTYDILIGNTMFFLGDLVLGVEGFSTHVAEILNHLMSLISAIFGYELKNTVQHSVNLIAEIWDSLADFLYAPIYRASPKIAKAFQSLADQISLAFQQFSSTFIEQFNTQRFEKFIAGLLKLGANIVGIFTRTKNTLYDTNIAYLNLFSGANSRLEKITWLITRIINAHIRWYERGVRLLNYLFEIKKAFNWIADQIRPIVEGFVLASTIAFGFAIIMDKNATATERLRNGILSITTLIQHVLLAGVQSLFDYLRTGIPSLTSQLNILLDSLVNTLKIALGNIQSYFSGTIFELPVNWFVDWILPQLDSAKTLIQQWVTIASEHLLAIVNKIQPIIESMINAGAAAVQFTMAITESESVFDRVKALTSVIIETVDQAFIKLQELATGTIFEGPVTGIINYVRMQIQVVRDLVSIAADFMTNLLEGDMLGAFQNVMSALTVLMNREVDKMALWISGILNVFGLDQLIAPIQAVAMSVKNLITSLMQELSDIFSKFGLQTKGLFLDTAEMLLYGLAEGINGIAIAVKYVSPLIEFLLKTVNAARAAVNVAFEENSIVQAMQRQVEQLQLLGGVGAVGFLDIFFAVFNTKMPELAQQFEDWFTATFEGGAMQTIGNALIDMGKTMYAQIQEVMTAFNTMLDSDGILESLTNPIAFLGSVIDALLVSFGSVYTALVDIISTIPYIGSTMQVVGNAIGKTFSLIYQGWQNLITFITYTPEALHEIWLWFTDTLPTAWNTMVANISVGNWHEAIMLPINALVEGFKFAINYAWNLLNVIGLVGAAFGAGKLGKIIFHFARQFRSLNPLVHKFFRNFTDLFSTTHEQIATIVRNSAGKATQWYYRVTRKSRGFFGTLLQVAKTAFDAIKLAIQGLLKSPKAIKQAFKTLSRHLFGRSGFISDMRAILTDTNTTLFQKIKEIGQFIPQWLTGYKGIIDRMTRIALNQNLSMFQRFVGLMKIAFAPINTIFLTLVVQPIQSLLDYLLEKWDNFKQAFGLDKELFPGISNFGTNIADGFADAYNSFTQTWDNFLDTIETKWNTFTTNIQEWGSNLWTGWMENGIIEPYLIQLEEQWNTFTTSLSDTWQDFITWWNTSLSEGNVWVELLATSFNLILHPIESLQNAIQWLMDLLWGHSLLPDWISWNEKVGASIEWVKEKFRSLKDTLSNIANAFVGFFQHFDLSQLFGSFSMPQLAFASVDTSAFNGLQTQFSTLFDSFDFSSLSMASFTELFDNFDFETFGTELVSNIQTAIDGFSFDFSGFLTAIESIKTKLSTTMDSIFSFGKEHNFPFVETLETAYQKLLANFSKKTDLAKSVLTQFQSGDFIGGLQSAFSLVFDLLTGKIQFVINALDAWFPGIAASMESIKTILGDSFGSIIDNLTVAWAEFSKNSSGVFENHLLPAVQTLSKDLVDIITYLSEAFIALSTGGVHEFAQSFGTTLMTTFQSVGTFLANILVQWFPDASAAIQQLFDVIGRLLKHASNLIEGIVTAIKNHFTPFILAFSEFINHLMDGDIAGMLEEAANLTRETFLIVIDTLKIAVRDAAPGLALTLEIVSDAYKTQGFFDQVAELWDEFLADRALVTQSALNMMFGRTVEEMEQLKNQSFGWLAVIKLIEYVLFSLTGPWRLLVYLGKGILAVVEYLYNLVNKIYTGWSLLINLFYEYDLSDIFDGMIQLLKELGLWIWDLVNPIKYIKIAFGWIADAIAWIGEIAFGHSVIPDLIDWLGKLLSPIQLVIDTFNWLGDKLNWVGEKATNAWKKFKEFFGLIDENQVKLSTGETITLDVQLNFDPQQLQTDFDNTLNALRSQADTMMTTMQDTSGISTVIERVQELKNSYEEALKVMDTEALERISQEMKTLGESTEYADSFFWKKSLGPSLEKLQTVLQATGADTQVVSQTMDQLAGATQLSEETISPLLAQLQSGSINVSEFAQQIKLLAHQNGINNDQFDESLNTLQQWGTTTQNAAGLVQQALSATNQAMQGNTDATVQFLDQFTGGKIGRAITAFTEIQTSAKQVQASLDNIDVSQLDAELGATFPKLQDALSNLSTTGGEVLQAVLEKNIEKLQELAQQKPDQLMKAFLEIQSAMTQFEDATNGNIDALKALANTDTELGRLISSVLNIKTNVQDLVAIYKGELTNAQKTMVDQGITALGKYAEEHKYITDQADAWNKSLKENKNIVQELAKTFKFDAKTLQVSYRNVDKVVRDAAKQIQLAAKDGTDINKVFEEQLKRVQTAYTNVGKEVTIQQQYFDQMLTAHIEKLREQGNETVTKATFQNVAFRGTMDFGDDIEGKKWLNAIKARQNYVNDIDLSQGTAKYEQFLTQVQGVYDKWKAAENDLTTSIYDRQDAAKNRLDAEKVYFAMRDKLVDHEKQQFGTLNDATKQWLFTQDNIPAIFKKAGIASSEYTEIAIQQAKAEYEHNLLLEQQRQALEALVPATNQQLVAIQSLSDEQKVWLASTDQGKALLEEMKIELDTNTQKALDDAVAKQRQIEMNEALNATIQHQMTLQQASSTALNEFSEAERLWFATTEEGQTALKELGLLEDEHIQKIIEQTQREQEVKNAVKEKMDAMKAMLPETTTQITAIQSLSQEQQAWIASTLEGQILLDKLGITLDATTQKSLDDALAKQQQTEATQELANIVQHEMNLHNLNRDAMSKLTQEQILFFATTEAGQSRLEKLGMAEDEHIQKLMEQTLREKEHQDALNAKVEALEYAYERVNTNTLTQQTAWNNMDTAMKTWLVTTDAGLEAYANLGFAANELLDAEVQDIEKKHQQTEAAEGLTLQLKELYLASTVQTDVLDKLDVATQSWMASLSKTKLETLGITLDDHTKQLLESSQAEYNHQLAVESATTKIKNAYNETYGQVEQLLSKVDATTRDWLFTNNNATQGLEKLGVEVNNTTKALYEQQQIEWEAEQQLNKKVTALNELAGATNAVTDATKDHTNAVKEEADALSTVISVITEDTWAKYKNAMNRLSADTQEWMWTHLSDAQLLKTLGFDKTQDAMAAIASMRQAAETDIAIKQSTQALEDYVKAQRDATQATTGTTNAMIAQSTAARQTTDAITANTATRETDALEKQARTITSHSLGVKNNVQHIETHALGMRGDAQTIEQHTDGVQKNITALRQQANLHATTAEISRTTRIPTLLNETDAINEQTQAIQEQTDAWAQLGRYAYYIPVGRLPITNNNLPTYHSGGLAKDELFAILQSGEYVLSRNDVAAIRAGDYLSILRKIQTAPIFHQGGPVPVFHSGGPVQQPIASSGGNTIHAPVNITINGRDKSDKDLTQNIKKVVHKELQNVVDHVEFRGGAL